jgi:Fe-S-cluster containining protein
VEDEVRALAARELAGGRPPLVRLRVVAADTAEVARRLTDQARAALPPPQAIACEAGCAWCCHLPVGVTLAELAALVEEIARWPDADAFRAQVRQIAASRGDRQPCPLLDENKQCRAYSVRPLACRGLNSFSARRCESHFFAGRGTLRTWSPQFEIHCQTRDGVAAAIRELAGDVPLLELVAALDIALVLPPAQWLEEKPWRAAALRR